MRDPNLQLSLIDAGIVAELNGADRRNFMDLFSAVILNDAKSVGRLMIERSLHNQNVSPANREKFEAEMAELVGQVHREGFSLGTTGVSAILQTVLSLCYSYQVKIDSRYVSVILALGILEGLGRRLDPEVNIIAMAVPVLAKAELQRTLGFKRDHD